MMNSKRIGQEHQQSVYYCINYEAIFAFSKKCIKVYYGGILYARCIGFIAHAYLDYF